MARLEGWESRLADIVAEARSWEYRLGERDCFRFACLDVEALTGIDRWPEFSGYRTEREALQLLARHGHNFEAAFDWFFESDFVCWTQIRRGDVAVIEDGGRKHLAICLGASVMGLLERGPAYLPLDRAVCGWRIG